MANLGTTFDASTVAPQTPFEILPPGKYKVQVIDSDMRPTKDGGGQYLWLEMEILDGEYAGRKLWDRLNLVNQNAQAVEIAQRQLSALCHATGQLRVSDSDQLHFKPVVATVRVRQAQGSYDASNEVRGYEAAGGASPAQPVRAAPAQQQSAPAPARQGGGTPANNAAPWKRKAS